MAKLRIVVIVLFGLLSGTVQCASADVSKNDSITRVELKYSNPSMGPHERRVSYGLDTKDYRQELTQLLDKTTVNGAMTLGSFLRLWKAGDAKAVERVQSKFKPSQLGEGRTIQKLSFTFSDKTTITLDDLGTYDINGYYYSNFEKLIQTKGAKSVEEPIAPRNHSAPRILPHRAPEVIRPGDTPDY